MNKTIAILENKKLTTEQKIDLIMKLAKRDAVKIERKEVPFVNRVYRTLCCN